MAAEEAPQDPWLAVLGVTAGRETPEGPHWKTAAEIATLRGTTVSYAHAWALRGVRAGTFERFKGRVDGHVTIWYRPAQA